MSEGARVAARREVLGLLACLREALPLAGLEALVGDEMPAARLQEVLVRAEALVLGDLLESARRYENGS